MRHRLEAGLTDRATITRRVQTGTENHEPVYERQTVAEGVPCQFSAQSTSHIHEDTGERVQRPASATFLADVEIEESDHVEIDGHGQTYVARGIQPAEDHIRGGTLSLDAELERAD